MRGKRRGRGSSSATAPGWQRIIAVAWVENLASRTVLQDIGMGECDAFDYRGRRMIVYESLPHALTRVHGEVASGLQADPVCSTIFR